MEFGKFLIPDQGMIELMCILINKTGINTYSIN